MALPFFVESAPRAYRLKAGNADPTYFNIPRDIPRTTAGGRMRGRVPHPDSLSFLMKQSPQCTSSEPLARPTFSRKESIAATTPGWVSMVALEGWEKGN